MKSPALRQEQPRISVVVTTIGREEVNRAVVSASGQTCKPIEIVVINDSAVRVDLPAVVDGVAVRVVDGARRGANAARNLGIRESHGDWVALLDDDDYWLPHKLETVGKHILESDRERLILTSQAYNEACHAVLPRRPYVGGSVAFYLFNRSFRCPRFDAQIQTSGLVFPRSLGIAVPFRDDLRSHQDWDWLIRACRDGCAVIASIHELLYVYSHAPGVKISLTPRLEDEQEWALSTLPAASAEMFGYFMTIGIPRALSVGSMRLALKAMFRAWHHGRFHAPTALVGGYYFALGVIRWWTAGRGIVGPGLSAGR